MKRLGQKLCVAAVLSLAFVAIWHDAAQAAMPVIGSLGQIKDKTVVNPTRIDVDAAGTIYLCDGNVNGVTRYDKYGRALPTLKGDYTVRSNGVAVTPDGSRVFVSVAAPGKITPTAVAVINGSTGALIGYLGAGFEEFKRVVEIDLDGNGNIYVGNFDKAKSTTNLVNTAEIKVYDASTYAKINSFGRPATNLVSGYYRPLAGEFGEIAGLTVDVANQEVLVAEGWNNDGIARVQIFGLDGTFKVLRTEASVAGTQVNCKPTGLTVDPAGHVYMLSILTSTIHVFTTRTATTNNHPTIGYLGKYTKGTPDPAYDPNGNVYPWTVGMIPTPSFDTVFDPLTGRLFVVTDGNGIQIYSVDGSKNPENINSAPQVPGLGSPVQDGEVATLTPTLQWAPAVDAENDPLKYNVKIDELNGTTVLTQNNITTTSFAVPAGILLENSSYRWQVQAADAEFTTAYSASRNFWVNAVEEAPSAASPVAPNPAATVNKNTVFSWAASTDVDPFDTVTYRLEIAQDTSFAAPLITVNQSGLTSVALSSLPGAATLKAGETYLWRVIAVDSTGLTRASGYRSFDCNSAPAAPALLSPVQGAEVATLTPNLQWAEAIDADGDSLTYNVQVVDADGATVNMTTSNLSVVSGTLLENKKYDWKVQAADLELTSAYSAVESFWVNAVEEAPTAATLLGPVPAATISKETVFSWQDATDADPFDTLTYRLEISLTTDFAAPVITVGQSGVNSMAVSALPGYATLQAGKTYLWRVVAIDSTGLATASDYRSFDCNSAPETPALLSPVQEASITTLVPTLQWAEAVDADGDTLTYNVQILDANGTSLSVSNNVAETSLAVAGGLLAENNQYGWQVQAADFELASAFSAVESFWVNTVEEAPTSALLVDPAAAADVDKDAVFSWQAATDPDPLAVVTYRLEISESEDFTAPVISVEQSELSSAAFSTLPGYADLKANNTYQWRVVAIDNSGLSAVSEVRSFTYVSTTLTIDATFSGAKVYLGGNSAYSGRYVGKAPVEVRDLTPGTIEVVVERPGFEPWISSVIVNKGQSSSVNAKLVVAILPGQFLSSPLLASGVKIQGGAEAAPVVVDYDSNGIADLLVADGSGNLLYYAGVDNTTAPVNAAVQLSAVTLPVGAAPFVADWNNDDRKDLLVGAADGSVSLYLNVGTQNSPVFAAPVQLQADYAPLSVGSNATPLLFDLNDDGAKDLVVGSGDGALYSFLNIGKDNDPVFAAREVLIEAVEGAANAAATVADWDADGSKEIVLANKLEVAIYSAQPAGTFEKLTTFAANQSIYNTKTRKYELSPASFGEMIRPVTVNFDGICGKDLLFGNADGQILLAKSTSSDAGAISPLYAAALLESIAEIETMIRDHNRMTPQVTSFLNQMKTTISSQVVKKTNYYYKAKQFNTSLQRALKADAEVSALLARLQIQLDSSIPLK